jgi:drug/metabolite transporter (DMT)-like permease
MGAVVLSLSASLSWGLADFLGGTQTRRHPLIAVVLLSQLTGLLLLGTALLVRGEGPPPVADLAPAAIAGVVGFAAVGVFYRALAVGTISVVAPIAATSAAVPVLAALLRGERPGPLHAVGILAAFAGVVLASREPASGDGRTGAGALGVGLALASALLIGLFLLGLDAARGADLLWVLFTARVASATLAAAAALVLRPRIAPRALPVVSLVGALDTAANGFFVAATSTGLLSIVGVLSSLYPVVTVALAHHQLDERLARVQRAGVGLALAGVVLLSAA